MTRGLYLTKSRALRSDHIDDQIISAETPDEAVALWSGSHGYG